jgi:hypothetical protein
LKFGKSKTGHSQARFAFNSSIVNSDFGQTSTRNTFSGHFHCQAVSAQAHKGQENTAAAEQLPVNPKLPKLERTGTRPYFCEIKKTAGAAGATPQLPPRTGGHKPVIYNILLMAGQTNAYVVARRGRASLGGVGAP